MSEYNERYIGEVFIDGKSNKLLQEFLTELFNSYNGPGKGFNADMVDDWHLDDIITYVDDKLADKLSYIKIGNTLFNNLSPEKYLEMVDVIYDGFIQEDNMAPWVVKIRMDEPDPDTRQPKYNRNDSSCTDDEYYLSSDIVYDIYTVLDVDKVDLDELNERWHQVDDLEDDHNSLKEDYTDFKNQFKDVFRKIKIIDDEGHEIETYFLDSQMVNGFRFIPITQAKYDTLPSELKNFWRNIYIISDDIPEDYIEPISMEVFKHVKIVYNRNTQWLEYYDGLSDDPKQILSLADLWSGANMNQQIAQLIENDTEITYNPIALRESLKHIVIPTGTDSDYPFLTKNEATYLASEITSNKGTITAHRNDDYTTFDISNAFDTKFSEINTDITNKYNILNKNINDLATNVQNTYVTKNTYNTDKNAINSNISSLTHNLDRVENNHLSLDKLYTREQDYHNGFHVLIGRWRNEYQGEGEYSAQLKVGATNAVEYNGIYLRFLNSNLDKGFDISKIIAYVEMPNGTIVSVGNRSEDRYKIYMRDDIVVGNTTLYATAMSGKISFNTPGYAGKSYMIRVVARYYDDGKDSDGNVVTLEDRTFPAYALKKIDFV